jgi:hypothetical protein
LKRCTPALRIGSPLVASLLIASLLSACASVPPGSMPARDQVGDFALEARFALRVSLPEQAAQSSGGRLTGPTKTATTASFYPARSAMAWLKSKQQRNVRCCVPPMAKPWNPPTLTP